MRINSDASYRQLARGKLLPVLQAGEGYVEEAVLALECLPSSNLAEVMQKHTDGGGTLLLYGAQLQRLLPRLVQASAFDLASSTAHALAEQQRVAGNYRVSAIFWFTNMPLLSKSI